MCQKVKIRIVLFISLLCCGNAHTQSQLKDSLLHEISLSSSDSVKAALYHSIAELIGATEKDSVLYYLSLGQEAARRSREQELEFLFLSEKSRVYQYHGDYKAAIAQIAQASTIARQIGKRNLIAYCTLQQAGLYASKGDLETAITQSLAAVEHYQQLKDTAGLAEAYNILGSLYGSFGEPDKAEELFEAVLYLADAVKKPSIKRKAYHNLAALYMTTDKVGKSIAATEKALQLSLQLNDLNGLGHAYSILGEIYLKKNQLITAKSYLDKALQVYKKLGNTAAIARIYEYQGTLFDRQEEPDSAIVRYYRAIEAFKYIGAEQNVMRNSYLLAQVLAKSGYYESAFAYLSDYDGLRDKLYHEAKSEQIQELIARYEAKEREQQIAILEKDSRLQKQELSLQYIRAEKQKWKLFENELLLKNAREKAQREAKEKVILEQDIILKNDSNRQLLQQILIQKKQNEIQALKLSQRNYIIAGLAGIILFSLVLTYLLIKQNRLRTKHKLLKLEQKALRAQMNPHFFFNALNSIQSCILHEEPIIAYEYHGKFAKLMRFILISSASSTISLQDELQMLKLYLDLEALRLSHKFEYVIKVDTQIEKEGSYIPSMILQPYIENAIWHGISPLQKNGKLWIRLKLEGKYLKCIIEDNGIGRKAAMAIKAAQGQSHKSIGMEVTKERIHLYNLEHRSKVGVSIIDLNDEAGTPLGTKVEILIPGHTIRTNPKPL